MNADWSVLYISSLDWGFRKQDHQFIATELASRGHRVVFVENTGARLPGRRDIHRVIARLRNWSAPRTELEKTPAGIEVVSPLCIPGAGTMVERTVNKVLLGVQLRRSIARLRGPCVAWIALPTWTSLDLADRLRPDLLVYYAGDAFTELPGLRQGIAESESAIARRADLVFATSQALGDHLRRLGADPILVPVAIDFSASLAARGGNTAVPSELRGLQGRIIGYMGGINYKLDTELVDRIAARFSSDSLVILGSVEDPRSAPAPAPNVVILGERPYERIGEYLAHFDVCLIPYRLNEYTAGVSPAKLLEYLSVGRPVVSVPLPEVGPFSDVVRIADRRAFLDAIAEVLSGPDEVAAKERRRRRAEEHSYDKVVARLVEIVDDRLHRRLR